MTKDNQESALDKLKKWANGESAMRNYALTNEQGKKLFNLMQNADPAKQTIDAGGLLR